jgi:RHS repeat-associated protein
MRPWSLISVVVAFSLVAFGQGVSPNKAFAATQAANDIAYVHDGAGRLSAAIKPGTGVVRYAYDAAGNLTAISRPSATAVSVIEFYPKRGPVGTSVTIYGTAFSATPSQNTVKFNGTVAAVASSTLTQIVATVPTGATTGPISVTSPSGTGTSAASFTVPGPLPPTVTGFTPTVASPGTAVSITGTNFQTTPLNDNVAFNIRRAVVASATATSISTTVPPGATSGKVSVGTPYGLAPSSSDLFVTPPGFGSSNLEVTTRMAIGETKTVSITGGNYGLVLFDGIQGKRVSLQPTQVTTNTYLSIFSPDGSLLAPRTYTSTGTFIDTRTLPATGTYTILLDYTSLSSGSITFTLYDVPPDITGTITPTQAGTTVTPTLSTPGQNAVYSLNTTQNQRVFPKWTNGTNGTVKVWILRPDGTTLASGTGTYIDPPPTLSDPGTYTVRIDPIGAATGQVTFTLYDVPPDITGTITPTQAGATVTPTLTPGQNALYTINATQGQRVFTKVANGTNGIVKVLILKPDGSTLTYTTGTYIDTQTLSDPGTYSLKVDPQVDAAGQVTVTLYDVPPDVTGTITIGGPPVNVTIAVPGQNGTLTFTGNQNQQVTVNITNSTTGTVQVTMLSTDGFTQLGSVSVPGATGSLGPITLPANGTYTIVVDPVGTATGTVTLTLTQSGRPHLSPVAPTGPAPEQVPEGRTDRAGDPSRMESQLVAGGGHRPSPQLPGQRSKEASTSRHSTRATKAMLEFRPTDPNGWTPNRRNLRGDWRTARPDSPWQELPPAQADPGTTALSGQVLTLNGLPLAGVTLRIEEASAQTDSSGQFLLSSLPPGHQELVIDGRTASTEEYVYGVFEEGVDLVDGQTNVLPHTTWMPTIDTDHAEEIDSPTREEVVITTPVIPGLELHLAAGTVITDLDGNPVTELSITAVPVDRPPFPLPSFVDVPLYFTIQPGGAYLSQPAQIVYPNITHRPPGERVDFWSYDPDGRAWYVYGKGTVTRDGTQVVPDRNTAIYEFTGAMFFGGGIPPDRGPRCIFFVFCEDADPVDLGTGLFVFRKTDLLLPDTSPIALTRVYRQADSFSRAFGVGMNFPYGIFLYSEAEFDEVDLILPDGAKVHYVRISVCPSPNPPYPCDDFFGAVFEAQSTPGLFYKSRIAWNGGGWDLKLKDGTVLVFGDGEPLQAIKDRYAGQTTLTRTNGQSGNISLITSPNGRWVSLSYDTYNRITQAQDNIGRVINYHYDSCGRMDWSQDAKQQFTYYTWDTNVSCSTRMVTIKDPRNIVFLKNYYDANDRVYQQDLADGVSRYLLSYTVNGNGDVTEADLTDPDANVRKVIFNSEGFITSDTRAFGKPEERTVTYDVASGTGLINAVTAPVSDSTTRTTHLDYETVGNITGVTRLYGTPSAVTTTFEYDPLYRRVASVTDPLTHKTTITYDDVARTVTAKDPLNHSSVITLNERGQPISVQDALTHTASFAYRLGDLWSLTDALGRTTTQFTDGGGRITSLSDPLGRTTAADYDNLNGPLHITDPLGNQIGMTYDADENLHILTNARQKSWSYDWDNSNRLQKVTDPLARHDDYVWDGNGNLTQVTDRRSKVTTYKYDGLNRLTFAGYGTQPGPTYTSTTNYTWDKGNSLRVISDSISGTVNRGYDDLLRLTSESSPQGAVSYTFDNADRRATMTVAGQSQLVYTFDNADRLTDMTQGASHVGVTYDNGDRPQVLTLPNGDSENYGFDNADELTGITYKQGGSNLGTLTYGYDAAGERNTAGGTWARISFPTAVSTTIYDDDNELTKWGTKTITYDAEGNLRTDGSTNYTYTFDDRNHLASISGGNTASFVYDGLGRRVKKTVSGAITQFLYDRVNSVQELSGTGTPTANLLTGLGPDDRYVRAETATTRDFFTDALGSPLALTDTAGAVQTSYTYEPFGKASTSGASTTSSYQFTGRELDASGLMSFRARYYGSTYGRFLSEDPIGLGGGTNFYVYPGNDPSDLRDPFGLAASTSIGPPIRAIRNWGSLGTVGGAPSANSGISWPTPRKDQGKCMPKPGYTDVNITVIVLDFGFIQDSCGNHYYAGAGLGSPGIAITYSPSKASCSSVSGQYFSGLGGAVGAGGPDANKPFKDWFGEVGAGTPGGGVFANTIYHCPG